MYAARKNLVGYVCLQSSGSGLGYIFLIRKLRLGDVVRLPWWADV